MRKISIISVLSLAFAILHTACLDDRIYHPGGTQNASLTVKEAKIFFENNAEELHLLAFSPQYSTKSGDIGEINITPRWEKAQARYNEHLSIVEVPLKTNVLSVAFRSHVIPGICQIDDSGVAIKKLTVMKRPNGNPHILVMTLLPDCGETSKIRETLENFNYMESHNFSGLILFSTTDGTFVEGYKYYKGKQQHAVKVTPVSEAADIISGEEPYDMLRMANMSAGGEDDSIYDDAENTGNMICDYCNGNGCPECANPNCTNCFGAGCTHCNTVNLGDVTVTPDPDPEPWYPGTGIDVTPDDRCPLCGYITCKGNCQDKEEDNNQEGSGGYTPVPSCTKCKQPVNQCRCPQKTNCDMVSINNGSNTSFHWLKFNELDIESIFLDKYRSANIEWSISLNEIQENTFATTDAHTDNQTNTIRTQYTPNTVAAIHNHPGGYPPSYTDVFALVNLHEKYHKFQYQFVAPKNSNFIYCLYLTDFEKAKQLRNKYKENPTLFQEEEKKLLRWLISNGGGAFPESEFAAYALAGVLQQEDSGIVLLQLNGTSGEFKQLHATVKTDGKNITNIVYKICK